MSNTHYGVWDPAEYPKRPEIKSYDFAAWLILNDATIDGVTYDKDSWLIYVKDGNGSSSREYWRITKNLILQNPDSSINTPDPGFYTKVRLDNNGNIVDASDIEYEDLPKKLRDKVEGFSGEVLKEKVCIVLSDLFQNSVLSPIEFKWDDKTNKLSADLKIDELSIKLDEDGYLYSEGGSGSGSSDLDPDGPGSCAIHEHRVDQIIGFDKAVQEIINGTSLINSLKDNLKDLVDGETIIINNNGYLESIATHIQPHKHTMNDISDLNQKIANVWAANQYIHNVEEVDSRLSNGLVDLSTLTIKEALIAFNDKLKELETKVNSGIIGNAGQLVPAIPTGISGVRFNLIGETHRVLDISEMKEINAYKKLKIEAIDVVYNPGIKITPIIDGVEGTEVKCYTSLGDISQGHVDSGFTFNYVGDAYRDLKSFQGYYKGFTFIYETEIAEGTHTIKFKTEEVGTEKVEYSKEYTFDIYEDTKPVIELDDTEYPTFVNDSFVSGNPCYQHELDLSLKLVAKTVKSKYAPINAGEIEIDGEAFPLEIESISQDKTVFKSVTKKYSGSGIIPNATVKLNSIEGNEYINYIAFSNEVLNYDNTFLENKRVIPDIYDSRNLIGFLDFDEKIYYEKEAVIKNNMVETLNEAKYISLVFPCKNTHNFIMNIENKEGNPLPMAKDHSINSLEIYAGLSTELNRLYPNTWINCNKPFEGWNSIEIGEKDFAGLDVFKSTPIKKYITMGRSLYEHTGYLYICIKILPHNSLNIKAIVDSIEESVNGR